MNTFDQSVLAFVRERPGTTMPEVAANFPVESKTYGRQRAVSAAIVRLRKRGLIQDCTDRCDHCGAARTRGVRNVPLFAINPDITITV